MIIKGDRMQIRSLFSRVTERLSTFATKNDFSIEKCSDEGLYPFRNFNKKIIAFYLLGVV